MSQSRRETTARPDQDRSCDTRRHRGALTLAAASAAAFALLSVLVASHVTQRLDDQLGNLLRPHGVWGVAQLRADRIVEDFRPVLVAPVLVLAGVCGSLWRRSWRPAAYAALIGGAAVVVTSAVKLILGRPDANGQVAAHSGSFPSGHTVGVLVCLGGSLLVVRGRTRWWEWVVVGLAGLGMGTALLVERAHWFTDVVGGALLASALLAVASHSRLRRSGPDHERGWPARVLPR